jgi:hypothetical protein
MFEGKQSLSIILFAGIFIMSCLCIYGQEVIIETRTGGQNLEWYNETSGKWHDSDGKSIAKGITPKIGSRFANVEDVDSSKARFIPNLPTAGFYEVLVTWPREGNAKRVKYIIHHANGDSIVFMNQDGWGVLTSGAGNGNAWHSLGTYQFPAGQRGYVEITDAETQGKPDIRNWGRVYADAVRFVFVSSSRPVATAPPPAPSPTFAPVMRPTPLRTPFPIVTIAPTPVALQPTVSQDSIQWTGDIYEAQRRARSENRNIMLYFRSDKSRYCQKYEAETLKDPAVIQFLNSNYVSVRFDFLRYSSEAFSLGAYKAPTFIFYDSRGNPKGKIDTFLPSQEFLDTIGLF